MKYRIAIDSCGEIPADLAGTPEFVNVPLTLEIGGETIIDDGHVSQLQLVRKIAAASECPKTACPSPEAYARAFDCDAKHKYAITLSAELSGSYQSAVIGMNMYKEDHPDAKVHVFNSRSASGGLTLTALMIRDLEEQGVPFEQIVAEVEDYIINKNTLFVLDNLETLRKNGRLSRMKALAASILKIKPICYGTREGEIGQLDQARGINKALVKMVNYLVEMTPDPASKRLAISYCNCHERAIMVRDELLRRMKVREVLLIPTGGVSTVYANDGGIIVVI